MLLLANAGLAIFTLVIVQNLNDVFLHRARSPRGVETKMKIQWIILSIVTFFYGTFHFPLITSNMDRLFKMDMMALITVLIFTLQVNSHALYHILNASRLVWNQVQPRGSELHREA
ncbi:hypothetical protein KMI_09g14370 [Encephalitozoon hellem]|nr:hypothetical protein KMI_09g14370 [Encephalitozoon hellem]